jgi:exopolysaccharide biosynthesis predicted pyruvyltransferase EpsI
MPNGGNLGDSLIGWATVQRFQKLGIKWSLYRDQRHSISSNDILVYGGGGSLVPQYTGGIACVERLMQFGSPVVVLPQTCRGHEAFWSKVKKVTVFCRDFKSLAHMSRFPGVNAMPAHDMALALDVTEDPLATSLAMRSAALEGGLERVLLAYRRDVESLLPPPIGSVDLSAVLYPSMTTIASLVGNASALLAALANYSEVRTDRLHVAIAAAHLGIPTTLRDTLYGKNHEVYEASLKSHFPSVRFEYF